MIKKIVAIGGGENGRQLEDNSYTTYDTKSIDQEIIKYVKDKHKLLIGERTAEEVKINVGTVFPDSRKEKMTISSVGDIAKSEINSSMLLNSPIFRGSDL